MKLIASGPDVAWLGHATFKISAACVLYIDPYHLELNDHADVILLTHSHSDHMSPGDIVRISAPDTVFVAPQECASKLAGHITSIVRPGDKVFVKGVSIEAVPAYNTNKFRSPGQPFHPKADGKVGYIVTMGGIRIYHAGDTDVIPEMAQIACDVALLPISGTYTMTVEEAAQAADLIKAKVTVPMHYGALVGQESDAVAFQKACSVPVTIMHKGE